MQSTGCHPLRCRIRHEDQDIPEKPQNPFQDCSPDSRFARLVGLFRCVGHLLRLLVSVEMNTGYQRLRRKGAGAPFQRNLEQSVDFKEARRPVQRKKPLILISACFFLCAENALTQNETGCGYYPYRNSMNSHLIPRHKIPGRRGKRGIIITFRGH